MSGFRYIPLGVILIAACAVATAAHASYDSLMGDDVTAAPATGFVLFSDDSFPVGYNTAAPNYVAPPAYLDRQTYAYCRPFSQRTRIGNEVRHSNGTACLQPDGNWRVVQ
jgi:hypothetical protein